MVVTAYRVARHIGALRIVQRRRGIGTPMGPVVHSRGNHAHGPGNQLRRSSALASVPAEIVHLAVEATGEPCPESGFRLTHVNTGDAELLEAQRLSFSLDVIRQGSELCRGERIGSRRWRRRCVIALGLSHLWMSAAAPVAWQVVLEQDSADPDVRACQRHLG